MKRTTICDVIRSLLRSVHRVLDYVVAYVYTRQITRHYSLKISSCYPLLFCQRSSDRVTVGLCCVPLRFRFITCYQIRLCSHSQINRNDVAVRHWMPVDCSLFNIIGFPAVWMVLAKNWCLLWRPLAYAGVEMFKGPTVHARQPSIPQYASNSSIELSNQLKVFEAYQSEHNTIQYM